MKPLSHFGIALAVVLSLSACDPKKRDKKNNPPAPGPTQPTTTARVTDPTVQPTGTTPRDPVAPPTNPVVPEPPKVNKVEYAVKLEGKTGYVTSPYDPQKRAIDVRGLPSGTEVEDPYNPGRTLLVP